MLVNFKRNYKSTYGVRSCKRTRTALKNAKVTKTSPFSTEYTPWNQMSFIKSENAFIKLATFYGTCKRSPDTIFFIGKQVKVLNYSYVTRFEWFEKMILLTELAWLIGAKAGSVCATTAMCCRMAVQYRVCTYNHGSTGSGTLPWYDKANLSVHATRDLLRLPLRLPGTT